MDNMDNKKKQKEIELILLMRKQKDNKEFINAFIALYSNEELYGIMRKMQQEIRSRNIEELRIYND